MSTVGESAYISRVLGIPWFFFIVFLFVLFVEGHVAQFVNLYALSFILLLFLQWNDY